MFSARQMNFVYVHVVCILVLHCITLFFVQELVKRAVAISYENGGARGTSWSKCIIVGMKYEVGVEYG